MGVYKSYVGMDLSLLLPGPRQSVQIRRCNLKMNGIEFNELPLLREKIKIQDKVISKMNGVYYEIVCLRSV